MLHVAKQLNNTDLEIIYYIRNLRRMPPCSLMYALKRIYLAQEEYEKLLLRRNGDGYYLPD